MADPTDDLTAALKAAGATARDEEIVREAAEFLRLAGPPGTDPSRAVRRVLRRDPERWSKFLNIPEPAMRALPAPEEPSV